MQIRRSISLVCLASVMSMSSAQAQFMDVVKGAMGGGSTSAVPNLGSVGTGNIAGVMGYCLKNKYLGGGAAGIKDKLMGKLGGERQAKSDPGYQDGLKGILGGKSGQKMNLSGGGLKAQITEKVCDQVLKHGQSLI